MTYDGRYITEANFEKKKRDQVQNFVKHSTEFLTIY